MGLDITAYRQLTPAPEAELDEDGYVVEWDKYFQPGASTLAFTENNWPGRSAGVSAGQYSFSDSLKFRAGSYSGYNAWRNDLAVLAGYGSADRVWNDGISEGPFVELINFSDCEGVIGPVVSAKLAKDFASFADKAAGESGWFPEQYQKWRSAFEMAADGGCVDFH